MKNKNKVYLHHTTNKSALPKGIIEHFAEIGKHESLKEQRDLFSEIEVHDGMRCRWARPSRCLPYHHIIEANSYGEAFRVHILIQRKKKILTLERSGQNWRVHKLIKQRLVQSIIPRRHLCGGWLRNAAKKSTIVDLSHASGLHHSEIPNLTESNALLLISLIKIQPALPLIRKLTENHQPIIRPFKMAA